MKNNTAEEKILELVARLKERGRFAPTRVSELPSFPFSTYEEARTAILSGKILIQRFAFEYLTGVFDILATPIQRAMSTFYLGLTYLGPIVAIVLAFMYSWWFLPGIFLLPIGMSKMKAHYNHVIFTSALKSELFFCFLYSAKQISLTTPDYRTCYYWGHESIEKQHDA